MSIYEVLGIGYVIASTTFFTAQGIYFGAKGVTYMQRLIQRAQTEETLDLQRSLSIKRELANVEGEMAADHRAH
jgi:hypothetical protein